MYEDIIKLKDSEMENFFKYFPILEELKNTRQDSYYHGEGDVWTHTKLVCSALKELKEYKENTEYNKNIMYFSALLHDIGKFSCTKLENGKITSIGHSVRGSVDARILLWKYNFPFEMRESIVNIIANHQVPFFIMNNDNYKYKTFKLSYETELDLLINVAKADMMGRIYENKQNCLNDIEIFRQFCEEMNCLNNPKKFFDDITKCEYFRSDGSIDGDFKFYKKLGSDVVVLSGLPAVGKDFYINSYYKNLEVVSFDDAKEIFGVAGNKNPGQAVSYVINKAKELLRNKEPFVWNATNINPQLRKKCLDLLFNYDASVSIKYLEEKYETIMSRNAKRNNTLTNKKIDDMLFKWSVPKKYEANNVEYIINNSLSNKYKIK